MERVKAGKETKDKHKKILKQKKGEVAIKHK